MKNNGGIVDEMVSGAKAHKGEGPGLGYAASERGGNNSGGGSSSSSSAPSRAGGYVPGANPASSEAAQVGNGVA